MYTVYEVDYNNRSYELGKAETIKEAQRIERKRLKKTGGEHPTFTVDGENQITNNGKVI